MRGGSPYDLFLVSFLSVEADGLERLFLVFLDVYVYMWEFSCCELADGCYTRCMLIPGLVWSGIWSASVASSVYFIPCVVLLSFDAMPPRASRAFLFPFARPSLQVPRRLISASLGSLSIGTDFTSIQRPIDTTNRLPPAPLPATDVRPSQVFHESMALPNPPSAGPSMPPLLRDSGLSSLGRHPTIATSSHMNASTDIPTIAEEDEDRSPSNEDLFSQLPGGKPRTFILVEDPQRGSRVRVKVGLDKVKMQEIPDSYRKANAVYPRTYFPTQMKDAPGKVIPSKRFFRDDTEQVEDAEDATVGRTVVPAPSIDGERDIAVPKLSRSRHRKEIMLNDLGYRLSWCQSRIFAGRMLFLQRSCKIPHFP